MSSLLRARQDLVNNRLVDFSSHAHYTVFIVLLLAVGKEAHSAINEDVSWPGVEVVAGLAVTSGEHDDVCDFADVWTARLRVGWVVQSASQATKRGSPDAQVQDR